MPDEPSQELLTAAEAGDPDAQNAIGRFYAEQGAGADGVDIAKIWFRRAADQGLLSAKHNLGILALREGRDDLAQSWFAAAAEHGWLPSMFALGAILEGAGSKEDATRLYEAAAKQGYAEAQDALGRMMLALDTPEGYEQSRAWSELASAQGNANAYTRLATIYHEGLGVARDPRRAASFFQLAAQSGHSGAQFMIGVAYEAGAGVEINLLASAFWLTCASYTNEVARHYLVTRVEPRLTQDERDALKTALQEVTAR
jgi:TPR repeat protein